MRRMFLSCLMCLSIMSILAQSNVSQPMNFRIEKDVIPPYLSIVPGSVRFSDANGNDIINANEQCYIRMRVQNTGKGEGYGCTAKIQATGTSQGLTYQSKQLSPIRPGETRDIEFPISTSMYTANGSVQFTVQVDEPHGFGTDIAQLTIPTRKFEAPMVEIVSYKITSEGSGKLLKKKPFKLQLLLQNTDLGMASNVIMQFRLPENMFLLDGEKYQTFQTLAPNEKRILELELQSNNNVPDELDLDIQLAESYGRYAKNAKIPLQFGKAIGSSMTSLTIAGKEEEHASIKRGTLFSDIDENIPTTNKKDEHAFALIIANENYENVAAVPFAINDGNSFRTYCHQTLGVPEKNIQYVTNATGNNLRTEINTLKDLIQMCKGQAKVIFYYAGHGVPDNKKGNGNAYLLPTDGVGSDYTTGYKLDDLYAALGEFPSRGVTIFLDACFSGGTRVEKETIDPNARGIAVKVNRGQPVGNMVVFSAAQEDQTANPDMEQQHGLFTYYLLKKIQETNGNATMAELTEYVIDQVSLESVRQKHKQVPCLTPSPSADAGWKQWKLKY